MKLCWPTCRVLTLIIALLFNVLAPLTATAQGRMRRPPSRELADAPAALLASSGTLPVGTLLVCEVETQLDSKTALPGDRFRARVLVPIVDRQGRTLVPADSLIEGSVEFVQRAQSRRRSGIIEVSFKQLIIQEESYALNASLVPATEEEGLLVDDEGHVTGKKSSTKRTVAFIGGGAGAGAVVGAFTAGAILGAGVGAGVGLFAALMAKGKEAVVEPGRQINIELNQPLTLTPIANDVPNDVIADVPDEAPPIARTAPKRPAASAYENPPPPGYETPLPVTPRVVPRPTPPRVDPDEAPRPRPTPTPRPATKPVETIVAVPPQSRPAPRPAPIKPETPVETGDTQTLNVSNLLAERGADGKVRVSITAQAPTAGWRLVPEQVVENGILHIKLKGAPPQGMVAQVISYPTTVVTEFDPERKIQRVVAHGQTNSRSTIPLSRGGNNNNAASNETSSATGMRIADKLDALVEDFAKQNRAWRTSDGTYSFEEARTGNTPEAQLLYAFDRLAESARVFRGSLTPEVKRRAVRELTNGTAQVNRILPATRIPAAFTQRWQGIEREINQLAANSGTAASASR